MIPINEVRAEFARRKVRFHPDEGYDEIKLWGLFAWGDISEYIKSGQITTRMRKENHIIWCRPSSKEIEKYIKPLVDRVESGELTLDELTIMAGWGE